MTFQDLQAFEGPLNYTGILLFRKSKPTASHRFAYSSRGLSGAPHQVSQTQLGSGTWIFREPRTEGVVSRILSAPVESLGQMTEAIAEGIVTGKNPVFLLTATDIEQHGIERQILRKAVRGRQVRRYSLQWDGTYVIYPYRRDRRGKTAAIPEVDLKKRFPHTYAYLVRQRPSLSGRAYFERSHKLWYELWCERDMTQHAVLKILTPELADSNKFAVAPPDHFYLDTVWRHYSEEPLQGVAPLPTRDSELPPDTVLLRSDYRA